VQAAIGENSIEMTRVGVGDRVAGYWFPGNPDKRAGAADRRLSDGQGENAPEPLAQVLLDVQPER
jgi:hypothetical protein